MAEIVKVRDVKIGEGLPKICVSLIGKTLTEIKEEAFYLNNVNVDLVEWRVDFFDQCLNLDDVDSALKEIREVIGNTPLLFTFRTANEGGEKDITIDEYVRLYKHAIRSNYIDMLDIELFQEKNEVVEMVKYAKGNQVVVIISNHDFAKTPTKEEILHRLKMAEQLGADIPKIAVMPKSEKDVLLLLEATLEGRSSVDCPIVTMSMGGKGSISRLSGELFGSSITFGAAKSASAPGQIPLEDLKQVLHVIHHSL